MDSLTHLLTLDQEGIWRAPHSTPLSYPEEGNQNCLQLEEDSFWFEHRNRCIQLLARRFPPGGVFLDVGGGNGYVAMGLQNMGVQTALLEPGETGARMAKQRGVQTVLCATLEDAQFAPATLAAVGLFDVLEHIQDDEAFLRNLYSLLRPGGRLYLTVPAYSWLWSADDDYAGHFRRYTLSGLKKRLRAAGLHTAFCTYLFFFLPPAIFLGRTLPTRLGWKHGNEWDRYQSEHQNRGGISGKTLDLLLSSEKALIERGQVIPFGGSCLLVAEKD